MQAYNFSDNRFDSHALLDIVKVVEHEKEQFRPDFIFTHHGGDLNIDHQMTFQAVMTATRPMEDEPVKAVFAFETPSASEWQATCDPRHFMPNLYMEISEADLKAKCDAMAAYEFESRTFPHPRSSEALKILAQYRGYTLGKQLSLIHISSYMGYLVRAGYKFSKWFGIGGQVTPSFDLNDNMKFSYLTSALYMNGNITDSGRLFWCSNTWWGVNKGAGNTMSQWTFLGYAIPIGKGRSFTPMIGEIHSWKMDKMCIRDRYICI